MPPDKDTETTKARYLKGFGMIVSIVVLCVVFSMLAVYFEVKSGTFGAGPPMLVREHPVKEVVILDSNKASDKIKIKDVLEEVSKNYTDEKFKTLVKDIKNINESIRDMQVQIGNLEKNVTSLNERFINQKQKLTSQEHRMKNLTEETVKSVTDLQDQLTHLSGTINQKIDDIVKSRQTDMKELVEKEIVPLRSKFGGFDQKIKDLQKKAEKMESLEWEVDTMKTEHQTMQKQLSKKQPSTSSATTARWNTGLLLLCAVLYMISQ